MIAYILLILTINIDALSYGIAYGINKQRIKFSTILFICTLSTILFAVPLYFSKYIMQYFNELYLRLINGIVLILLGVFYLLKTNSTEKKDIELKQSFKQVFFECLAISADAIFTALLSGFNQKFYIFLVFFYAFSNFFAIFLGNIIFLYFNKKLSINFSLISGFIFIFLGIFKLIGF